MGEDGLSSKTIVSRNGHLVFGVGSLHHLPFRSQRLRILRQALDLGFRHFDVAPAYGNGLNELDLGLALQGHRATCQVTTKFGIPVNLYGARSPLVFPLVRGIRRLVDSHYGAEYRRRVLSPAEMTQSLEGSLQRLRRDCVDDFMIHEPLDILTTTQIADLHETASRLKDQGKIIRWGVCGPSTSIGQFVRDPEFDVFQFPLDAVDEVNLQLPRRKIGYGVYRSYVSDRSIQVSFPTFVSDRMKKLSMDLIIATNSCATLTLFRECL
jgi:aryl-alcohol dehydrogenase-like predicted oxidoreductase